MFRRRRQPQPPPREPYLPPQLHPAQMRRIDWIDEARTENQIILREQPRLIVPAASDIQMPQVTMASPDAHVDAQVTPFATIEGKTLGSHSDRARAWIRYAIPLCGSVAVVATIMAWTLAKVPILSFWSLLIFGLAFVFSYTLLLLNYWRHTPEGVALDSSRQLWGFLRSEQDHRHAIDRQAWSVQRQRLEDKRNE